ncbi:hypothetical protein EU546_08050 [Candidatus Thorarchaeota archaeon]|nr:MAG: hypothetical protein EU546_08050 [Candidatus Thorarchaeota archaeon]
MSRNNRELLDKIANSLEAAKVRTFLHKHPERELHVYESASETLRSTETDDTESERRRLALLSESLVLLDEALCVGREHAQTERLEEAVNLAERSGDEVQQARALVALAIRFVNLGHSHSADGKWVKVLMLAEKRHEDPEMMSMVGRALLARGQFLAKQSQLERAETLLRDALSTLERTDDRVGLSMAYDMLARVLLANDQPVESERYALLAEETRKKLESEYPVQ